MQPLFSYFGSKYSGIIKYPEPDHSLIVEPFAGSACYALQYFDRDVWLNDIFPPIYELWKWIIQATKKEIHDLPVMKVGEKISDIKSLSIGERNLLGFLVNDAPASPRNTVTPRSKKRIARSKRNLLKIAGRLSHWRITNWSYEKLPNKKATWYIDPPYQFMGKLYVHNSDKINYADLGKWCLERRGQIIVCEGKGADWLPFQNLFSTRKSCQHGPSSKVGYYSEKIYHRQTKKIGFGFNLQGDE